MLFLVPPRTAGVAFTTRSGGSSVGPYAGLNLGNSTKDDPDTVRANRRRVARALGVPEVWGELRQVHGSEVREVESAQELETLCRADALVVRAPGVPVAVFAADCLPVALVSDRMWGVAHAGWRGLSSGILDRAVRAFDGQPVQAWIGPSIGPCHYQVGPEVVEAFRASYPGSPEFWQPDGDLLRFDLRAAARWVLRRCGVTVEDYDPPCTFCDARFYSYRRDGETGRHAVVVWG
ncbi:MAG TPA: peptidoglycan editing factor PgeF [Actinomycetota bacterium]|nr:peptidoglycan editing factor PgeF [Actinomycetota bacterium]